jgi:hypothetical protein
MYCKPYATFYNAVIVVDNLIKTTALCVRKTYEILTRDEYMIELTMQFTAWMLPGAIVFLFEEGRDIYKVVMI